MEETVSTIEMGMSELTYLADQGKLTVRGWVSNPSWVDRIAVVSPLLGPLGYVQLNTKRKDIAQKYHGQPDDLHGFNAVLDVALSMDTRDIEINALPKSDLDVPVKHAARINFREQTQAKFTLDECTYDTESKFLHIKGAVFPDLPQRALRLAMGNVRTDIITQQFLPTPRSATKTAGVINRFAGFEATIRSVGQGVLPDLSLMVDHIDGSTQSFDIPFDRIKYDLPSGHIEKVDINLLAGKITIKGWYRSYTVVSGLSVMVFGHACHAIPKIKEDPDITKRERFRGPSAFSFEIEANIEDSFKAFDLNAKLSNTVSVGLLNRDTLSARIEALPANIHTTCFGVNYIVFDKRKSLIGVWGSCTPGMRPSEVAVFIGGRQIGQRFKPIFPDLNSGDDVASWMILEEINFELRQGMQISIGAFVDQDEQPEMIVSAPAAIIVAAENVVENADKNAVLDAILHNNLSLRKLQPPIACFTNQGSMLASGGALTRLTSMMESFKRAGYSIVLIDRTAPWEYLGAVGAFKQLMSYTDAHLVLPQYYKAPILEREIARVKAIPERVPNQNTLLQKLEAAKKDGRLIKGDNKGIFMRIDSQFNYLCASLVDNLQPDLLISSYLWSSEIHTALPPQTFGMIDTIDIQSSRFDSFVKAQATYGVEAVPVLEKFQINREMEQELLNMAQASIAISPDEQDALIDMVGARKTVLATLTAKNIQKLGSPQESKSILFIGNNYEANNYGINAFIKNVWPKVKKALGKTCTLDIIGSCGGAVEVRNDPQIKIWGLVPDIQTHYENAAVVINPVLFGTGVSAKMIEALSLGKACVATEIGARALEMAQEVGAMKIVKDDNDFATQVINAVEDIEERRTLEQEASRYAGHYLSPAYVYSNLFNFIETKLFY